MFSTVKFESPAKTISHSEVWFKCPCPIVDCKNKAKDVAFQWNHHECSGAMKVSSEGYLLCTKCSTKGDIIDWKFECEYHDFKPLTHQGIIFAISTMCQVEQISDDWLAKVIEKIKQQKVK